MRLIQLLGDMIEELWNIPDEKDLSTESFQQFYKDFEESEYDDLEEFLEDNHPEFTFERVFADEEIYV